MAVIYVIYFMCLYMAVNPSRWTRFCGRFLLLYFVLFVTNVGGNEVTDFVSVNILPDGEIETRIHYNGISAKETRVSNRNENGLKFRQLTDGRRLIQLIYENETLKDCEFVRQKGQAITFLKSFKNDLRNLIPTSNITLENLDGKPLPRDINTWFSYKKLRNLCKRTHRRIRNEMRALEGNRDDEQDQKENNSRSRWTAKKIKTSANRDSSSSFLLAPGTLWCGHLDNAARYTHLGVFSGTDSCCRKHDRCKKNIDGYSKRYQFFNPAPFTISHCFCDTSFRACLKMVGTSDANLVGKIFFNVVQTKCFVLKRKKVCAKKSWWGKKCLKKKVITKAILRDNIPY